MGEENECLFLFSPFPIIIEINIVSPELDNYRSDMKQINNKVMVHTCKIVYAWQETDDGEGINKAILELV